jgi:hypothetical protein
MHFKDTANLLEIRPPGNDCLFVVLHVKASRRGISLAPLHEMPLDIGGNPIFRSQMNNRPCGSISDSAHVVKDGWAGLTHPHDEGLNAGQPQFNTATGE